MLKFTFIVYAVIGLVPYTLLSIFGMLFNYLAEQMYLLLTTLEKASGWESMR